jgi:hypothetical protein
VLTMLPLLSRHRDESVEWLRARGVEAWHWRRQMPGCAPDTTPNAWSLHQRMFLVRTPDPGSPVYDLLGRVPLERWPS